MKATLTDGTVIEGSVTEVMQAVMKEKNANTNHKALHTAPTLSREETSFITYTKTHAGQQTSLRNIVTDLKSIPSVIRKLCRKHNCVIDMVETVVFPLTPRTMLSIAKASVRAGPTIVRHHKNGSKFKLDKLAVKLDKKGYLLRNEFGKGFEHSGIAAMARALSKRLPHVHVISVPWVGVCKEGMQEVLSKKKARFKKKQYKKSISTKQQVYDASKNVFMQYVKERMPDFLKDGQLTQQQAVKAIAQEWQDKKKSAVQA